MPSSQPTTLRVGRTVSTQGDLTRIRSPSSANGRGRDAVRMLGAILRLAEGLDRSHAQVIAGLDVVDGGKEGIVIRLRTAGDAELEVWSAGRHAEALADELDAEIHFAVSPVTASRRGTAASQSRSAAAGKRRRRAVA